MANTVGAAISGCQMLPNPTAGTGDMFAEQQFVLRTGSGGTGWTSIDGAGNRHRGWICVFPSTGSATA